MYVFQLEKLIYLTLTFQPMNNNVYELLLINNSNSVSYLIDVFQENTINSQDIILDYIDKYRQTFKGIDKNIYSLVFRKIKEVDDDWKKENIIKIKDASIFYVDVDKNILFEDSKISSREIIILENIKFKL